MEEYGRAYFEERYRYGRKRRAIVRLYMDMLKWADGHVPWSLLSGEGRRALDVGCAYGFVTDMLRSLGYESCGLDLSEYALRAGRKEGITGLVMADGVKPPFKAGVFDLVTCFETLEHLTNPEEALRNMYELLTADGVFLATTSLSRLDVSPTSYVFTYVFVGESPNHHASVKAPEEWRRLLLETGFKNVLTEPFLILPVPPTVFDRYFKLKAPTPLASSVKILALKG